MALEAYKYAMSHLPVHEPVLKHAEVIKFEQCHNADFQSLVFFVESKVGVTVHFIELYINVAIQCLILLLM